MESSSRAPLIQVRETIVQYRPLEEVREAIRSPEDIVSLFWKLVRNNVQEHVCLFCLDGSHAVVNCSLLFTGTANQSQLHAREVYQVAVITGACGIILAHNHPSGELGASGADLRVTNQLKEAGNLIGIPLVDHIIVTEKGYNSAQENAWL